MSDCQRCGGRANDAFLCGKCVDTLRAQLRELPWWLERLTETALGMTKMTDNGGRRSARRKDIDGDATIASCIETLPTNKDDDLDQARREREHAAMAHALAAGRINAKASELLAEVADGLGFWMRVILEYRGLNPPPPRPSSSHGAGRAIWLAHNVRSIAQSEGAGDICTDVEGWLHDIAKAINRPVRFWPLGACPAETTEGPCEAELPRVPEHTEEVSCRDCGARHVVSRVLLIRKHEREGKPQKRRELVRYNGDLPPEFQVPPRTLRHWLTTGVLPPCAFDGEDPLYSWVDVRLLMLDRKARNADKQTG